MSSTSSSESRDDVELPGMAADEAEQQEQHTHSPADGRKPDEWSWPIVTPGPNPRVCGLCWQRTFDEVTWRCTSYPCQEVKRLEKQLAALMLRDRSETSSSQQGRATPRREQETVGQEEEDKGGHEDHNVEKLVAASARSPWRSAGPEPGWESSALQPEQGRP